MKHEQMIKCCYGLECTLEYVESMNGSAKRSKTDWTLTMKPSDATVSNSTCRKWMTVRQLYYLQLTCIPPRLRFKHTIREKNDKTCSLDSSEARTMALNIWKSADWKKHWAKNRDWSSSYILGSSSKYFEDLRLMNQHLLSSSFRAPKSTS